MIQHWDEVTFVLATLVMKAEKQDPDGMDLYFTCSKHSLKGTDKVKQFREVVGKALPQKGFKTDMDVSLKKILDQYLLTWETRKKYRSSGPRDRTIIVFTDGIWKGMTDQQQVFNLVVDFYNRFTSTVGRKLNSEKREVSIEFVQFGADVDASARLRRLDDDMGLRGIP
jgi:hypothetical protein